MVTGSIKTGFINVLSKYVLGALANEGKHYINKEPFVRKKGNAY